MTYADVQQLLEKHQNSKGIEEWKEKLLSDDNAFGLSAGQIEKLASAFEKDATLADELYTSNNHDLKLFATYIDDPQSYTRDELKARIRQLYPSPFAFKFCQNVLAKTPFGIHFIDEFSEHSDYCYRVYAYVALSGLAKAPNKLSDELYAKYIRKIEERIHQENDFVKQAMCQALISMGSRDSVLMGKSMDTAEKIGVLEIIGLDGKNRQLDPSKHLSNRRAPAWMN
jgi:hypothetical protein